METLASRTAQLGVNFFKESIYSEMTASHLFSNYNALILPGKGNADPASFNHHTTPHLPIVF